MCSHSCACLSLSKQVQAIVLSLPIVSFNINFTAVFDPIDIRRVLGSSTQPFAQLELNLFERIGILQRR